MKTKIRPAMYAGSWYEGNAEALKKQLARFFDAADVPETADPLRGLISPHAGYVYSGPTAAFGYKLLKGRQVKRVMVLAPSHYVSFSGAAVPETTFYETPLGKIPIDLGACKTLEKAEHFQALDAAHRKEHSLELQLPFLQTALKEEFSLIPIVIQKVEPGWYEGMAEALLPFWDDDTLIVASSDFTHYGRRFGYLPFAEEVPASLEKLDKGAVDRILALDEEGFRAYVEKTGATICGAAPIALLIEMADRKGYSAKLLHYTTSGAMTGDYENSVSYCSICFTGSERNGFSALNERETKTLLELSRFTLRSFLETGNPPTDLTAFDLTDSLEQELGVFVTLKKQGVLRGCIGYLKGMKPLYQAVMDNTINAAARDPRFPAVTLAEERNLHIEISVLSPVVPVRSLDEIVVGRDGLIIRKGYLQGTLLPQVPVEQGWDREEFLRVTCRKAGLPLDAYKQKDTVIERYSAQVFGEDS